MTEMSSGGKAIQSLCLYIDNLPDELILQVFVYLPVYDLLRRAALVCRKWHDITKQSSLWKVVRLGGQQNADDEILWRMTSLSPCVLHLDISRTSNSRFTNEGFIAVLQKCKTLKTLKLDRCRRLKCSGFKAIGGYCHQLQNLSLDECRQLNDEALYEIGHGCKDLRLLSVVFCCYITGEGLGALAGGCPMLKAVILDGCSRISDKGLKDLCDRCPDLEHLSVLFDGISSDGIAYVAKKCRKLRTFKVICRNGNMADTALKTIGTYCPQLQRLVLAVHGSGIMEAHAIPQKITDGLKHLCEGCPHIEQLNLVGCEPLNDAVAHIVKLRRLKKLALSCKNVSKKTVTDIMQCCPLEEIHAVGIDDECLEIIGQYGRRLQRLKLGDCSLGYITDEGLSKLAEHCKTLTTFNLSHSKRVTSDGLRRFLQSCPYLRSAFFDSVPGVTIEQFKISFPEVTFNAWSERLLANK